MVKMGDWVQRGEKRGIIFDSKIVDDDLMLICRGVSETTGAPVIFRTREKDCEKITDQAVIERLQTIKRTTMRHDIQERIG